MRLSQEWGGVQWLADSSPYHGRPLTGSSTRLGCFCVFLSAPRALLLQTQISLGDCWTSRFLQHFLRLGCLNSPQILLLGEVVVSGSHPLLWVPPSSRAVMAVSACAWICSCKYESCSQTWANHSVSSVFLSCVAGIVARLGTMWVLSAAISSPFCCLPRRCFTDLL